MLLTKRMFTCPSLEIRGQLPAPIVNGREDSFWKWPDFQLSRAHDLDLGSGHTAYRRASLIDLYLHAKFHWNQRNFLWTNGCMDGRTNGWTFETGFIRSTLWSVDLIKQHNMTLVTAITVHIKSTFPLSTSSHQHHSLLVTHWLNCMFHLRR